MGVSYLNRTLDQELLALTRGVSLECPVCGEFVLHLSGVIVCPECSSLLAEETEPAELETLRATLRFSVQAG